MARRTACTHIVVATANDIVTLPPELIRKGRFDEIFFVDLPDRAARSEIIAIHAHKRGLVLSPQELAALASRSESFSGAEIEQAIVAALYSAHAAGQPVTAVMIAHEMQTTRPLAVVMAEKVAAPARLGRRPDGFSRLTATQSRATRSAVSRTTTTGSRTSRLPRLPAISIPAESSSRLALSTAPSILSAFSSSAGVRRQALTSAEQKSA